MKTNRLLTAAVVATMLVASSLPSRAQDAPAAAAVTAPAFDQAQLEQLVAPIALYSDALLAQVLMASTYPLEIVEAARWLKKNPGLKGDALDNALQNEDWDPSVKGLCAVPDVVQRMNDNLEWTQDLGDAFLAQQEDVMYTVQAMRAKAHEAGNLKTTEQQKVVVKQEQGTQVIVVEQPSPQVIYVPTYSSAVVYGPTYAVPAPYYPAMYSPPGYGLLAFGAGMAVGAAIWGDCNWGYGYGGNYRYGGGGNYYGGNNNITINNNNYNNFNKRTDNNWNSNNNIGSGSNKWNHSPEHRKGVNYKNSQTAQKFGASAGQNRVTSAQARGYGGAGNRSGSGSSVGAGNRAGAGASTRPAGSSSVGSGSRAGSGAASKAVSSRPAGGSSRPSSVSRPSSGGAFQRSGSSSMDRAASSRGAASRGGFGGGGGGSGGGGGRGGRGGGRR